MVTYFLGEDEVLAYLRDFLERLTKFDPLPSLWCPMTRSGDAIQKLLNGLIAEKHPEIIERISVLPLDLSKDEKIVFPTEQNPEKDINGKRVLLFDGAIHSGRTMSLAAAELLRLGAADVCSYSLVVKRGSSFFPTLWGLMMDETDRAFFLLSEIPNNRLHAGACQVENSGRSPACVHIRRLCDEHLSKEMIKSEVPSMDRVTWSDRNFDMHAGGHQRCTYLLEQGTKVLGYITIRAEPGCLYVDELAVDVKYRGKDFGGILMRFGDNLARHMNCRAIRLYAISGKIKYYEKFGYHLAGQKPIHLDTEEYHLMERPVLYNHALLL